MIHRPVVPGCAGCAMAHSDFGRSVNPISTRGTDYAHLTTTGTPEFSDLPTALDVQKNQDSRIQALLESSTSRSLWHLLNDFGQGHDVSDAQKNQDSRIQTLLESSTSRSLWHLLNNFDQSSKFNRFI